MPWALRPLRSGQSGATTGLALRGVGGSPHCDPAIHSRSHRRRCPDGGHNLGHRRARVRPPHPEPQCSSRSRRSPTTESRGRALVLDLAPEPEQELALGQEWGRLLPALRHVTPAPGPPTLRRAYRAPRFARPAPPSASRPKRPLPPRRHAPLQGRRRGLTSAPARSADRPEASCTAPSWSDLRNRCSRRRLLGEMRPTRGPKAATSCTSSAVRARPVSSAAAASSVSRRPPVGECATSGYRCRHSRGRFTYLFCSGSDSSRRRR